jgi:hypothetical protein
VIALYLKNSFTFDLTNTHKHRIMKKLIINRGENLSTFNDQIIKTSQAISIMCAALKLDKAKLMLDNATTLMYIIAE